MIGLKYTRSVKQPMPETIKQAARFAIALAVLLLVFRISVR